MIGLKTLPILFLSFFFLTFNFSIAEILIFLILFSISKVPIIVTPDVKEMSNYRAQPALDGALLFVKALRVLVSKAKKKLPGTSWNSLAQAVLSWQGNV